MRNHRDNRTYSFGLPLAVIVAGTLSATGCSHPDRAGSTSGFASSPAAEPKRPAVEPAERLPQSPMTARLHGPDVVPASGEIELRLDMTRADPTLGPISLTLDLPTGAQLVEGEPQSSIQDAGLVALSRRWRIRYATLPAKDARLIVDWRSDAAGFHAELPYRFGRMESKPAEPKRMPNETRLPNGVSLGRPILTR